MKIRLGIMLKFVLWYFVFMSISYAIILILFIQIRQIMGVSSNIVEKNYAVSSVAKRMIESLLSMEENDKKYHLLNKPIYKDHFVAAQKEFEEYLIEVQALQLEAKDLIHWIDLERDYWNWNSSSNQTPSNQLLTDQQDSKQTWIAEEVIDRWIQTISQALSENEQQVETQMRRLHHQGQLAVRWGMIGLGISLLAIVLGCIFMARSIHRPLRELLRGIRAVSRTGVTEPIQIWSKDEFGELARAFNEMTGRLREEERMRSDFISMLSHEIRTPLTSIRESVNLIQEEVLGPIHERQKRFLEIASKELDRIANLLNHLMQVSRLETGALDISPCPLDPYDFVMNSIHRLTPLAEAKNVSIQSQVPREVPQVVGDPNHLDQVFLNLLGNAIKFSPPGGEVMVKVDFNDDHTKVRFCVSDKGPGIPEDEQVLVFHKYYRVSGMRDDVDGVGLGLSISKHIVEAHGEILWVESRVNQGSTFGFTLPVASGK